MIEDHDIDIAIRNTGEPGFCGRDVLDLVAAAAEDALNEPPECGIVVDIDSLDYAVGHYRVFADAAGYVLATRPDLRARLIGAARDLLDRRAMR